MGKNGWLTRFFTPLEKQRTNVCSREKTRVLTKRLCVLLYVLLYCSSTWWSWGVWWEGGFGGCVVGWVGGGRFVGFLLLRESSCADFSMLNL